MSKAINQSLITHTALSILSNSEKSFLVFIFLRKFIFNVESDLKYVLALRAIFCTIVVNTNVKVGPP